MAVAAAAAVVVGSVVVGGVVTRFVRASTSVVNVFVDWNTD